MEYSSRKKVLGFLLFFLSIPAFAEGTVGKNDNSRFYPSPQAYIVINAKFDDISKTPKDLRGIPFILRGSTVYITEKYFTLKNINSGSTRVIGSCFEQAENTLIIKPAGRFSRSVGKEIRMFKEGEHWIMPYGDSLKMYLKKVPLPNDFLAIKRQLDLTFNLSIKKGHGRDSNCKLTKISGIPLRVKNYRINYDDLGLDKIVVDGILDPDTPINSSYLSYANRIPLNENITIGSCTGNTLMYRYASGEHRSFFYIFSALIGEKESDNKSCFKIKELKKVYTESISTPYNVGMVVEGVILPPASFEFTRWEGESSLVIRHQRTKRDFLISGIDFEDIRISEIPFQEKEK